jgi:uncharacterized protein (DUF2062 family)
MHCEYGLPMLVVVLVLVLVLVLVALVALLVATVAMVTVLGPITAPVVRTVAASVGMILVLATAQHAEDAERQDDSHDQTHIPMPCTYRASLRSAW